MTITDDNMFFVGDSVTYYNGGIPYMIQKMAESDGILIPSPTCILNGGTPLCAYNPGPSVEISPGVWCGVQSARNDLCGKLTPDVRHNMKYLVIQDYTKICSLLTPYTADMWIAAVIKFLGPDTMNLNLRDYPNLKRIIIYQPMFPRDHNPPFHGRCDECQGNYNKLEQTISEKFGAQMVTVICANQLTRYLAGECPVPVGNPWRNSLALPTPGVGDPTHHLSPITSYAIAFTIYNTIFKNTGYNNWHYWGRMDMDDAAGFSWYNACAGGGAGYQDSPPLQLCDLHAIQDCILNNYKGSAGKMCSEGSISPSCSLWKPYQCVDPPAPAPLGYNKYLSNMGSKDCASPAVPYGTYQNLDDCKFGGGLYTCDTRETGGGKCVPLNTEQPLDPDYQFGVYPTYESCGDMCNTSSGIICDSSNNTCVFSSAHRDYTTMSECKKMCSPPPSTYKCTDPEKGTCDEISPYPPPVSSTNCTYLPASPGPYTTELECQKACHLWWNCDKKDTGFNCVSSVSQSPSSSAIESDCKDLCVAPPARYACSYVNGMCTPHLLSPAPYADESSCENDCYAAQYCKTQDDAPFGCTPISAGHSGPSYRGPVCNTKCVTPPARYNCENKKCNIHYISPASYTDEAICMRECKGDSSDDHLWIWIIFALIILGALAGGVWYYFHRKGLTGGGPFYKAINFLQVR